MAQSDDAIVVVDELSRRLSMAGLPKGPCLMHKNKGESYCTVSRHVLSDGSKVTIDVYIASYFGKSIKLWVGFCSRTAEQMATVQEIFESDGYATIAYEEWGGHYALPKAKVRELVDSSNVAFEDYTNQKRFAWFGQYMNLDKKAAARAAEFVVQIVDANNPVSVGHRWTGRTEREAVQKQRLAQGRFRAGVKKAWGGRCAVTGSNLQDVLRASHIAPWNGYPQFRTNPDNGLFLVATLDALFDRGLISFRDDGRILISPLLTADQKSAIALSADMKLRAKPSDRQKEFLKMHREIFAF
jgi:hypothetical protein